MFKNIIKNKKLAENNGSEDSNPLKNDGLDQVAYITITHGSSSLSHEIGNKLTIGSEIGEFICKFDGIASRHCTILKNNEVFCFIDHGSEEGTFLDGKRLDAGKTIFYSEGDSIKFGPNRAMIEYKSVPADDALKLDEFEGEEFSGEMEELPATPVGESTVVRNFKELSHMLEEAEAAETKEESVSDNPVFNKAEGSDGTFNLDEALNQKENPKKIDFENYRPDLSNVDVEELEVDESILQERLKKTSKLSKVKSNSKTKTRKGLNKPIPRNKKGKKFKSVVVPAANTLQRLMAIVIDSLVALSIYNVFYVFVDFKKFFDGLPGLFGIIFNPIYENLFKNHVEKYVLSDAQVEGFITSILLHPSLNLILSFILFIYLIRWSTTIILGTSIGQRLIGLGSEEGPLKKRINGFLRELLGFFLAPFILFDLPALFGKRTLKELVTRTRISTPGVFVSMFLSMILIPFLGILFMISPLIKGLETLSPVITKKSQSIGKPWMYKEPVYASSLKIKYEESSEIVDLPFFEIELRDNKRFLTSGITYLDLKTGSYLNLKKVKEFSMFSVLKEYIDLNYFSRFFEPYLYKRIREMGSTTDSFKRVSDKLSKSLIEDLNGVFLNAYELDARRLVSHIVSAGPMLAGHRDFREKLDTVLEKQVNWISATKLGGVSGILFALNIPEGEQYAFIPHSVSKSRVYVFSEDPMDARSQRLFHPLNFAGDGKDIIESATGQFIAGFKKDINYENFEIAQKVFEKYFNTARYLIEKNNISGVINLQNNLQRLLQMLKENKKRNVKLYLNLNELQQAIKKRDYNYLQIQNTRTI